MSTLPPSPNTVPVSVVNAAGPSPVVLVCEHASAHIPARYNNLGLSGAALQSHIAWDPGAMAVARGMAERLDAVLVASDVSRLVYDCNRPPDAPTAMPAQSEVTPVPGNADLSAAERADRTARFYTPFRETLAQIIAAKGAPVIVTVHSFTPVYHGAKRDVEIGILHDSDTRFADAMLITAQAHTDAIVRRNDPYGPEDGVTHTLQAQALPFGHLNVMIEVRNDLIASPDAQATMAQTLSSWLADTCTKLGIVEGVTCRA